MDNHFTKRGGGGEHGGHEEGGRGGGVGRGGEGGRWGWIMDNHFTKTVWIIIIL